MAALSCDICGGNLEGKPGGIFECDSCGMKYSTEWAKEKVQEIKGTVKVEGTVEVSGQVQVSGTATVESIIARAMQLNNGERIRELLDEGLKIEPQNPKLHLLYLLSFHHVKSIDEAFEQVENSEHISVPLVEGQVGWDNCMKYCDKETIAALKQIVELTEKRQTLQRARKMMQEEKDIPQAEKLLETIKGYKDADILLKTCTERLENEKNKKENLDAAIFAAKEQLSKDLADLTMRLEQKQNSIRAFTEKKNGLGVFAIGERKKINDEIKTQSSETDILLKRLKNGEIKLKLFETIKKNEYLYFGSYFNDRIINPDKSEIAWKILAVENGKMLLVCENILDYVKYNNTKEPVLWENSDICKWLNVYFVFHAFSEEEKNIIADDVVTNGKVFLLSPEEVEKYIDTKRDALECCVTEYAYGKGIISASRHRISLVGPWWLRGHNGDSTAPYVYYDRISSQSVDEASGVRPAIWVNLRA